MSKGEWLAFAGIVLTIVVTVIGATWYLGSTMATEADIAELRQAAEDGATEADIAEMRQEIRSVGERLDAQMEEIRNYLVDHFNGHPADN